MLAASRPTPRLVFGLALSLTLAACSTASPAPSGTPGASGSPAPGGTVLLLRVTSEGGFINPSANLAALPTVVVYADGRILTPGTPAGGNLSPLVMPVEVRDVGASGAAAILAAIRAAGLDKASTADPGVPGDSGMSVFEVVVGGATVTTRFAGNGPGGPGLPGVGGGDNPERAAALDLLSKLLDPAEMWGAASAPESVYQPVAYRVFVAPGAPVDDGSGQPAVAWPLATSLAEFGAPAVPDLGIAGLRTGIVLGADAAALAPVFAAASASTAFSSAGETYTLYVRALLPDEVES